MKYKGLLEKHFLIKESTPFIFNLMSSALPYLFKSHFSDCFILLEISHLNIVERLLKFVPN